MGRVPGRGNSTGGGEQITAGRTRRVGWKMMVEMEKHRPRWGRNAGNLTDQPTSGLNNMSNNRRGWRWEVI